LYVQTSFKNLLWL